jgi:hypothetical protein
MRARGANPLTDWIGLDWIGLDWNIQLLTTISDIPLLWIRVDPEMDWIGRIIFRQPEYMSIYQLELDRDVIAQYQAIQAITPVKSREAAEILFDVVNNTRVVYYYRVRMHAAKALAEVRDPRQRHREREREREYESRH